MALLGVESPLPIFLEFFSPFLIRMIVAIIGNMASAFTEGTKAVEFVTNFRYMTRLLAVITN